MLKQFYQFQRNFSRRWNGLAKRLIKIFNYATYPIELITRAANWFATEVLGRPLKYFAHLAEVAFKLLYRSPLIALRMLAVRTGISWLFRKIVMGPVVRKPDGELRNYAKGFQQAAHFLAAWFGTRDYQAALGGIPALLLMLAASGLILRLSLIGPQQVAAQYHSMSLRAFEEEDLVLANLCNRKLSGLGLDTQGSVFYAAFKEFEAGDVDSAQEKISQLAAFGEEDYATAHLWMVQHLVQGKIHKEMKRGDQLRLAEKHLRRYIEMAPENMAGRAWRAEIYLQWGNERLAYSSLEELVTESPDLAFRMFESSRRSGDSDAIRKDALRVIEQGKAVGIELLSLERQVLVAEAYEEVGDLAKAREVVARGLVGVSSGSEKASLLKISGRLAIAEYDQIKEIESASVEQRVELLKIAIATNAVELEVIERFEELYESGASSKMSAETIKSMINDADAPADVFLHFGTQAALNGKLQLARKLMQKCLKLDPDRPNALNNLAWLMYNCEPIDLDGAYKAVNKALLFRPNDARYRDTRGHIHMLRQEWQLAIQDLEFAVQNGGLDNSESRKSLEKAYRQIEEERAKLTSISSNVQN